MLRFLTGATLGAIAATIALIAWSTHQVLEAQRRGGID